MDSATTSRFSSLSRAMPISVSVPNWMIMLFLLHGVRRQARCPRSDDAGRRSFLRGRMGASLITFSGSKSVSLSQSSVMSVGGKRSFSAYSFCRASEQIGAGQLGVLLGLDGALDGQALGPLDHGGDDRAAGQIAAIEKIALAAAIDDFQELVFAACGRNALRPWLGPCASFGSASGRVSLR